METVTAPEILADRELTAAALRVLPKRIVIALMVYDPNRNLEIRISCTAARRLLERIEDE